MKQVIGIFMVMVFVFVFGSMALGENEIVYGINCYEACEMVHDWADNQCYWDWTLSPVRVLNGVGYACGALDVDTWKDETGYNEWSIDNFKDWMVDEWETCEVKIRTIGQVEGTNVYLCETKSETKIAGTGYNYETEEYEDCYCASLIFVVFSEKDINGNPVNIEEQIITENIIH